MKPDHCGFEEAIAGALRRGGLSENLVEHANQCVSCRDIIRTAASMREMARSTANEQSLPVPELLWSRARYAERMERAATERRRLEWLEIASRAAVPVGIAGWVAWNWFAVQAQAAEWLTSELSTYQLVAYGAASLIPALFFLGAISLVFPLLGRD
jgi:predicted anti-sigma-YlaC factor YlaD